MMEETFLVKVSSHFMETMAMRYIDERRKGVDGDINVWVNAMSRGHLVISVISGYSPNFFSEEDVRWLIEVLKKALGEEKK